MRPPLAHRRDRLRQPLVAALFLLTLLAVPLANHFWLEVITEIAILIIFVIGIDLLVGYTGLITFGHAGFMGVGAYVTTWLAVIVGIPVLPAMLLAILAGVVCGIVVGYLVTRVSGVFFIMVTLAFSMLFYSWAFKARVPFGGDDGLSVAGEIRPDLTWLGIDLADQTTFCLFALALAALVYAGFDWLVRTPFGQTLIAIRQNEQRVRAQGCPVRLYKLAAFTVAGAAASLAGALQVQSTEFLHPDVSHWIKSGEGLIIVIVGGMGSMAGPVIGVFVFVLFQKVVESFTEFWQIAMGITFILIVLVARDGIYGRLRALLRELFRRREPSATAERREPAE